MNDQRIGSTQRVIKYRAYDMHFEEMCYVSSMFWPAKKKNGFDIVEGHGVTGTPYRDITITEMNPLMQFTGLLDKHGKEIYEHDLYRRYSYVYRVEWDKDSASFAGIVVGRYDNNGENYSPCTSDRLFNISEDEETELVGNIYSNPELVDPKHETTIP